MKDEENCGGKLLGPAVVRVRRPARVRRRGTSARWPREAMGAMTVVFDLRAILFPTDYSTVSRHAAMTAGDIAPHFGARVHVLHVSPPGEPRVHAITRTTAGPATALDLICETCRHIIRGDALVPGTTAEGPAR